ncbi:MAG: hypothetical protein HQM00_01405 [Magnetococcales bacterium]|nr:hypothetical protein [Magnetococcales bacterium]
MASFRVVTPLRHDGICFRPGATLSLDPETAQPLLALGAVRPCLPESTPTPPIRARRKRPDHNGSPNDESDHG